MDDLISREFARGAKVPYDEGLSEYERGWNDACLAIADNAPSAQQWIPVSSGNLPKPGEDVLISLVDRVTDGYLGKHDIEDDWFKKIGEATVWYTDRGYYQFDKVLAWMEKPKPYQEGDDRE